MGKVGSSISIESWEIMPKGKQLRVYGNPPLLTKYQQSLKHRQFDQMFVVIL